MIFNSPYGFDFSGNIASLTATTLNATTINASTVSTNIFLANTNGATDYKCSGSIQLKNVSNVLPKIQFYATDASGGGITGEIFNSPSLNAFRMETSLSNGFQFNNNISTTNNITCVNSNSTGTATIGTASIGTANVTTINNTTTNATTLKATGSVQIKNIGTIPELQFFNTNAGNVLNGKIYTSQALNFMRFETVGLGGFEFSGGTVYVPDLSTTGTASIGTASIGTANVTTINNTTTNATTLKATGSVQIKNIGTIPELQFFNTNAGNVLNGKIYTSQALNFMRFETVGLGGFEFSGSVYANSFSTSGSVSFGTGNITTVNSSSITSAIVKATSSLQMRNVGDIPQILFYDTNSANALNGKIYTSQSLAAMRFDLTSSVNIFEFNGSSVRLGQGFRGKQGQNGATYGNIMNRWWSGSALQAFVDTTNIGNFTICDYRIKENIQPPSNVLDRLCSVPMFCFELKDIGIFKKKGTHIGFYAHELEEAFPELNNIVDGEKDDVTEEGEIQPQTVTSEFCNVLMRSIQEQQLLIKSLTQRVTELEQKLISL
jgi:hypothetical protein